MSNDSTASLVDAVIASVKMRSSGRPRWVGQPPYQDEVLVEEIERLRRVEMAARALLDGGFEREDTEYADALFACLEDALNGVDHANP